MVRGLLCLACTLSIAGCTDQAKVTSAIDPPAAPPAVKTTLAAVESEAPSPVAVPSDKEDLEAKAQMEYDALQAEFQKSVNFEINCVEKILAALNDELKGAKYFGGE